jgi:hypothetical protein
VRALSIVLILILVAEVCLLVLASSEEDLPADSDLPREQRVDGWQEAAGLAGTDIFKPASVPEGANESKLTVRGIPGDSSRPLAAEYRGGLVIREAHVDVDPQLEDEPAEVDGADAAWWGTVRGETYLYVHRGETLVVLSGLPRKDLTLTASSLRPVENG